MNFAEIEEKRARANIDQKELCRRAGVHEQTYSRLKNRAGPRGASEATLSRLRQALEHLTDDQGESDENTAQRN